MSFCFDDGDYLRLERGSSSDDCRFTLVSCSSTSGSIGVNNVISLVWGDGGETTLSFYAIVISSTGNAWDRGRNSSDMRGALLAWWRWKMSDVLSVLKIRWQESREFFCFSTETWATLKALWILTSRAIRFGWSFVLRRTFSLALESSVCCKLSSSEHRLPVVKLLVV